MSRMSSARRVVGALLAAALVAAATPPVAPGTVRVAEGFRVDVAVTGIVRPIQVALRSSGRLVVLGLDQNDGAAGEIVEVDTRGPGPVDASRLPRIVIPFPSASRQTSFGSLAVEPRSGDLLLGEENGNRVYRLAEGRSLTPLAVGLNHLVGGGGIAVDPRGRLVVLDYASLETRLRSESPPPPGWDLDGYQGPVVFRIDLHDGNPLPRRLDLLAPLFPRGWSRRPDGEVLGRFIAAAAPASGELLLLDSLGTVLRLTPDGDLAPVARLPSGHYHRTSMAAAADGHLFISTGFHIRDLFRVSPAGVVTRVARELGDPGGVAVDGGGVVYVAETALHRIIRIRPAS
jgi:hypothetical protein